MTPKLVVYSWKKLQVFKKGFFWKKCFQLITGDKIFKTVCGSISRDVLTFDDFKVTKFALYKKINKIWTTEKQGNFTHRFGNKYLTNHLVKFI